MSLKAEFSIWDIIKCKKMVGELVVIINHILSSPLRPEQIGGKKLDTNQSNRNQNSTSSERLDW